jgi:hypothetical protein
MTKVKELDLGNYLLSDFDSKELVYLIQHLPVGSRIASELDLTGSPSSIVYGLVDALSKRGALDSDFFEVLLSLRPQRAKEIREIWGQWEPNPEDWATFPEDYKTNRENASSKDKCISARAKRVFVSYSRRDYSFYEELKSHLTLLVRQDVISIWDEGRILAGDAWENQIHQAITDSDIFVLLISGDFLASEYSSQYELEEIFGRVSKGAALIPVLLRPCLIPVDHKLRNVQWLPRNGIPISSQDDVDEAWLEVAEAIQMAAERGNAHGK